MRTYEYTIIDLENTLHSGVVRAMTRSRALNKIQQAGLTVVSLIRANQSPVSKRLAFRYISSFEKIIFLRNVAAMLKAGLTLTNALASSREHSHNPAFKQIIVDIEASVNAGQSLTASFAKHPKVFSNLILAMVNVGEQGGRLVDSLEFLVEQMESDYRLKRKIKNALMYPCLIIMTMIVMVAVMMLVVIPKISALYNEAHVGLPVATAILISISAFISTYGIYVLSGLVFCGYIFLFSISRFAWLQSRVHSFLFRIWIVGETIKKINLIIITRSLHMLLHAGVSIDRSLRLATEVTRNSMYKKALIRCEGLVKRGVCLSDVLRGNSDLFLPLVCRMVATGEESGKLDEMLLQATRYYEEDLQQWTQNLSSLIEPILLLFMGLIVGCVAVAIMLPLWNLAEVL